MKPPEHERGAALLTVLMLVAIVAVMAGAALEKLRLSTRLAGNAAAGEQARAYALAAETLALTRIDAMLGPNVKRVTLQGDWSGKPFGMPLPGGGFATARVRDGGNCFNLNSLVSGRAGAYVTDPLMRPQFVRLMRLLDIPAQVGEQIAAGAADWIDSDQDQQAMGAEDGAYLNRETPYRTAGTLMTDPSELRAVVGMTPQIYATLRPWICTLPVAQAAPINVNTLLPEQAPLLQMLVPAQLSPAQARAHLAARPAGGYGSVNRFWSAPTLGGLVPSGDAASQVKLTTRWFRLRTTVRLGDVTLASESLIDAGEPPARVVRRKWGPEF